MSLSSWTKSFGSIAETMKTAAKEAQKKVDMVLNIEEEDEEEVEEEKVVDEEEVEAQEEQELVASTSGTLTGSKHNEVDPNQFKEVDLTVATTNETSGWDDVWDNEANKDQQPVIDAEPNPIRDTEPGTSLLHHYSPSSNSPNGEESNGNGGTSPAEAPMPDLDLSVINIDAIEQDKPSSRDHSRRESIRSHKTSGGHEKYEDALTVASSDIEVIRQFDTLSEVGSHYKRTASEVSLAGSMAHDIRNAIESKLFHQDESLSERLALLEGQLQHKTKQIEEQRREIDNLKATNASLTSKNKQLSSKAGGEGKLQKQLAEKEKELQELMEEGKRLSDHSGKQSREIRRLKKELENLEVVTAARDATMDELKQAYEEVKTLKTECDELKEKLETSEKEVARLQDENDLSQSSTDLVQKHISDQKEQIDTFQKEIHRLSEELRHANNAKEEFARQIEMLNKKLRNKKAQDCFEEERERGLIEDLALERSKNANLTGQIRELEQKIETMMSSQNDIAQQIATANAPLLENISSLENELWEAKNQYSMEVEKNRYIQRDLENKIKELTSSLNIKQSQIEELNREKRSLSEDNATLNEKYRKKSEESQKNLENFRKMESDYLNLSEKHKANLAEARETSRTLEQQNKRLTEEITNLKSESTRLAIQLKEKEVREQELERSASVASTRVDLSATPISTPLPTYAESVRISIDDIGSNPSYAVSALQSELRNLMSTYEQTLARVRLLESEVGKTKQLEEALKEYEERYKELTINYESLLEAHGERLERLEELELDLSDVKKVYKEQMDEMANTIFRLTKELEKSDDCRSDGWEEES